ncbi:DUF3084 domain-containing protein [bacterium]|nr:DUF3084 domain-containing protein [bacterium]
MTAVLFVLFLLVVAGLVAAAGDRMGHLAARRKIRFGNMRPRHVSTLIAVVTGILISLVTFLVLFGLWTEFRDALLRHKTVRAELATAEQELQSARHDLDTALAQTQQAVDDKAEAERELAQIEEEASNLRGQVAMAAMELDQKNQLIARREKDISQLNARKSALEEDISGYESIEAGLREVVGMARTELEAYKTQDIVLSRGTRLYYQRVKPAEGEQLQARLLPVLVRLSDQLAEEGLSLDPASEEALDDFVDNYPFKRSEYDTVVVITSANNVVKNGAVLLAFEGRTLEPLVKAGEEIVAVMVKANEATVTWRDELVATLDVPAEFDETSFADFAEQLWTVFNVQGKEMGFLPDLATGGVSNPISSLVSIYPDLAIRQRPFILQFVADEPANALDGLGGCDLYVSKWPPEP